MESEEVKQKIKDYFVEIKEDKFTKVKSIKCKHEIEWKGIELENKFMLTTNSYLNELKMGIDYRHKDEIDSFFFTFIYTNSDGGFPGMTNIKMYLILDDDITIELSEGSGFDHTSQSSKVEGNFISVYLETANLAVSMSDFIAIANAKKIEYSIRFGGGSLENVFSENDLLIFKGFYNAGFDDDFEFESLKHYSHGNKWFLDKNSIEYTIIEMWKKGQKLEAIKLYKRHSGLDLIKSKNFVEKLCINNDVITTDSNFKNLSIHIDEIDQFSKDQYTQDLLIEIFSLNDQQINLILDKEQSMKSMNSRGMMRWRNEYKLNGEILFGLSPNKLDVMMPNIFTTEGIYKQKSGLEPIFLAYSSEPNFYFERGGLFSPNKLIDIKTKFYIELASINPTNENGKTIINTILNFIKHNEKNKFK